MAFLWPTRISTPHREHVRVDHLIFEFEDPDPASKCGEAQDPTFWTGYEAERRVIIFCFEGVRYIVENRDVCPQCFENLRKNSDFGVDFLRGTVLLAISHNSPLLKFKVFLTVQLNLDDVLYIHWLLGPFVFHSYREYTVFIQLSQLQLKLHKLAT